MCVTHLSTGAVNVSCAVAELESPDYTVHFPSPCFVWFMLPLSGCFQLVQVTYRNSTYSAGQASEPNGLLPLCPATSSSLALCHLLPEISVFWQRSKELSNLSLCQCNNWDFQRDNIIQTENVLAHLTKHNRDPWQLHFLFYSLK